VGGQAGIGLDRADRTLALRAVHRKTLAARWPHILTYSDMAM